MKHNYDYRFSTLIENKDNNFTTLCMIIKWRSKTLYKVLNIYQHQIFLLYLVTIFWVNHMSIFWVNYILLLKWTLKTKYHTKTKYCKKKCDHNNKMIIIMEAHGSLVKKSPQEICRKNDWAFVVRAAYFEEVLVKTVQTCRRGGAKYLWK